jgi:phosphatidylglycerol:prolipoprotein diacylglycerol transferase
MHPVLIRIGSFEIGTYGLLLAVGFFLALNLAHRLARKDSLSADAITDLAITVLLAGILGSKLLMVVVDLAKGARLPVSLEPAGRRPSRRRDLRQRPSSGA